MVRAGWLSVGKMVIYPIRNDIDGAAASSSTGSPSSNAPSRCSATGTRAASLDDFFAALRGLALRLARRRRADPLDRDRARLSDGRPGSAAALELRPRHPARRRRAPDVSARLERRRPGDPRCALPRRSARRARRRRRRRCAAYDRIRNAATAKVVLTNRSNAARRDPARSARALGRQAVRAHRGRRLARRAGADRRRLQAGRRAATARAADRPPEDDGRDVRPSPATTPLHRDARRRRPRRARTPASPERSRRGRASWCASSCPYTPGTGMDILARTLGPHLRPAWGQAIVVDNRPGASGNLGAGAVAKSRARRPDAADGRQHADHQSGAVLEHELRPAQGPGADRPVRDRLVPARRQRRIEASSRSTSWSRRRAPGPARSTTPRPASRRRITWRWSCSSSQAKVSITHIPFSGTAGAVNAVLAGDVPLMFLPVHVAMAQVKGGRLVVLAAAGDASLGARARRADPRRARLPRRRGRPLVRHARAGRNARATSSPGSTPT